MQSTAGIAASLVLALLGVDGIGPTSWDGKPPSFRDVNGFDIGERITLHHEMVRYLERLDEASPRVAVVDQGESWQGRRLTMAIVTAPENHARLDEIQENARRLADPRLIHSGELEVLLRDQPAVVWLGGSLHGFELSGAEALLRLLEHLAMRDDDATLQVLRHTVVLIDPIMNPDSREAFALVNQQNTGREPNPLREDWNNDFVDFLGWEALKFRTGHYYFDLNRDWFAHTQPETAFRIPTLQRWHPQVLIDPHDMPPDLEFYFDPPADPVNPHFPDFHAQWGPRFRAAFQDAFDEAGFDYTTGELIPLWYPGSTSAYGSFLGGIGMLFEQGSTRGLAMTRRDGSVRTLTNALTQQYTAAWAAIRLAARERERLLREFHESQRAAVDEGVLTQHRYVIGPGGDPGHLKDLVNLLRRNGVEVSRVTEPGRLRGATDRIGRLVGDQAVGLGAFVVETGQPRNRLIRVLLEPDVPVPETFLPEARRRLDRGESPGFYDVTAWSLPLLFNVEAWIDRGETRLKTAAIESDAPPLPGHLEGRAKYAYVFDGRDARAMAAAANLSHLGHRVSVVLQPTRVDGREVSGGSVLVRVRDDDERLHRDVELAARRFELTPESFATGAADPGFTSLGASNVRGLLSPRIALLAEEPFHAYSFGWAWFTLDRQYEIPLTVLRVGSVARTPLHRFDTLVLPEVTSLKGLSEILGPAGRDRISRWVQDGGTLVAIGSSVDFVREELSLISLRSWYDAQSNLEAGSRPRPIAPPGAIFRAVLDPESWLTAGYTGDLPVLVNSSRLFLPPEEPASPARRVAAWYAADEPVRLSGHAWEETLERLPGAVLLYEERVGLGRVVAFAEDPNFRGHWRGADRLFLNAVLLGSAMSQ